MCCSVCMSACQHDYNTEKNGTNFHKILGSGESWNNKQSNKLWDCPQSSSNIWVSSHIKVIWSTSRSKQQNLHMTMWQLNTHICQWFAFDWKAFFFIYWLNILWQQHHSNKARKCWCSYRIYSWRKCLIKTLRVKVWNKTSAQDISF